MTESRAPSPYEPSDDEARQLYGWALAVSAQWRDDRNNRGDKSVWWGITHNTLATHAPNEDRTKCQAEDCGSWPCVMVRGAITDLKAGPAGW
ncbi:hypothetical protein HNR06_000952 [Nocardiopsis arvandica]|uniref:Uncharacterized protein n=1 Tax=Nocardiopsis sinuspersici TaxID=501010 RepID=A0A7Z0BH86_9ACTN|nr:hypothetical protein [Nocardiopsis sinuspersici]